MDMKPEPRKEHHWLQKLVGDWTYEHECPGEDGKPQKCAGTETVRSLGGLWTIGEGEIAGGGNTVMTLGYDPAKKKFVGTFIASMMTHLWPYEGELDAAERVLTLWSEGPDFQTEGKMAKYKDVIEFVSDDHRTLTSFAQGPDGKWQQFMQAHYRRRRT